MQTHTLGCLFLVALVSFPAVSLGTPEPGDAEAGKVIYERLCVSCHGLDGRGGRMARMLSVTPRNLADQASMQKRSAPQLFGVIKHGGVAQGLSADMPAFGNQLTDQDIWDTIAYVGTLVTVADVAADSTPAERPLMRPDTTDLRMVHLRLAIWPEYDDPRVLVMLRGEMVASSAFPTHITLPIPKEAEVIGAGMVSAQDELLLHPHQVIPGEMNDTLELNLPAPRFFVELYYNPFATRDVEKRFTYTFTAPYPIEQLEVDIQKPYEATNFVTEPQAMKRDTDSRGGEYHRFTYQDITAGESQAFTIAYAKTSDRPSVSKQQAAPSAEPPSPAPMNNTMVAFGLLAGVALLYAGGAFFWKGYQRRRETVTPVQERRSQPQATRQSSDQLLESSYCSNCGRKLQSEHAFCPGCGQSLHSV